MENPSVLRVILIGTQRKKMLRYRFEITYQTHGMKLVSAFMEKFDLGFEEIYTKDVYTFNYTEEEKPVSYFKELLRKALENCDCTVFEITGGKIE